MYIADDPDCCAVEHICGLSGHNDAHSAMLDFYRNVSSPIYGKSGSFRSTGNKLNDPLSAFYIFTGVVRWIDKGRDDEVDDLKYGPNFAKFIKDNKLGTVVVGPSRVNQSCHPEHVVRVWIWAPSHDGLVAWWEKEKKK